MFSPENLLDVAHTEHAAVFADGGPAWSALSRIGDYLGAKQGFQRLGEIEEGAIVGERVHVGPGSTIEAGAVVQGPAWFGANCTIRTGAYIRGNLIAGDGCILGNSCEFKNSLLFDGCEVPHFNYVGDSILGHRAHLGAGTIISNFRLDRNPVRIQTAAGGHIESGLRKFGAIIGDHTEIGCNSVLSPGSILGRRCILYPGTQWRGILGDDQIVKLIQNQEIVDRHP